MDSTAQLQKIGTQNDTIYFQCTEGCSLSALNVAEIGHGTLRSSCKLMLVDASWEDICTKIVHKQTYKQALDNTSYKSGKGSNERQIGMKEKELSCNRPQNMQRNMLIQMMIWRRICNYTLMMQNLYLQSELGIGYLM